MNSRKAVNLLVGVFIAFLPLVSVCQTNVSGVITEDTEWTLKGSPYYVMSDAAVTSNATLTIDPGVEIRFSNRTKLIIRGNLIAVGASTDSISFTSNGGKSRGSWYGIDIKNEQGANASFDFCKFSYAATAIQEECCWGGKVSVKNSSFVSNQTAIGGYSGDDTPVENCYFNNNTYCLRNADKVVRESVFENNGYGLFETERISVYNSVFRNHSKVALYGGRGVLSNCMISNNKVGIQAFFEGFEVESSTISENDSIGIILGVYGGRSPTITNSRICNNGQYNVVNYSDREIDIKGNCWCTFNQEEIKQGIYDGIDNVNFGIVSFTPLLDEGLNSFLPDTLPICGNDLITLDAGNEDLSPSYTWRYLPDDSVVSRSRIMETSIPGNYLLKMVTDCSAVEDTVTIQAFPRSVTPEICLVTADGKSSKNTLIWSGDSEATIQFGIYKETSDSGKFALIEYVDKNLFSSYTDDQSSPGQQSSRYKITGVDQCGTETVLSRPHKTMHLIINKGEGDAWDLTWNGYEGFLFETYQIYRSLEGGSFELLTEIASELTSYTDSIITSSDVAYQIEVLHPGSCEGKQDDRTPQYASSKSNIAYGTVTGINNAENSISISPNPTANDIVVQLASQRYGHFVVRAVNGKEVAYGEFDRDFVIDLSDQPQGVYILNITTDSRSLTKKIIKNSE